MMLDSRYAMWMMWGPEHTFFCNDAYRRDTLGKKYVVTSPIYADGTTGTPSVIRVAAVADDTQVTFDPSDVHAPVTLAAGAFDVQYIWQKSTSDKWAEFMLVIACVAQLFCGLASVTSASRR